MRLLWVSLFALFVLCSALPVPVTISVSCGAGCASFSSFSISVDGGAVTENPVLTLTRGTLYVFQVSTPNHPFAIHVAPGEISQAFRYSGGIQNNGVSSNNLVFLVPPDAPSLLYYQSETSFPLFGRINVVGGTTVPIPSAAPTVPVTTAPVPAVPQRFWTPICSGAASSGGSGGVAQNTAPPVAQPASPEVNPSRTVDQDDEFDEEQLQQKQQRKKNTHARATVVGVQTDLGKQTYKCTTSTRPEQLMDLCLFTLNRESTAASETCLALGPGIFTPVTAARFYMACSIAQYNAWACFDLQARPLGSNNPPKKRLASTVRTIKNKEIAQTFAVYNVIKYILPNRAADTAASLLAAYGMQMDSPALYGFAAQLGVDAANDFITSHLSVDGSNQEKCYASTVNYQPTDLPVQLGSLESVNQSRVSRINLFEWADVRDGTLIGARKFVTPHAFTWKHLGITKPDELIPTTSPLPSRDTLDKEMRVLASLQKEFITNPARKVQVALWADGPRTTLPSGHWMELVIDVGATKYGWDLDTVTKALLLVGVANYEAGVMCWQQKFLYRTVRPQEYIALTRMLDDIPDSYRGPNCSPGTVKGWRWRDYAVLALNTPAFPEYPSGHSTFSNASATVLALFTGTDRLSAPLLIPFTKGLIGLKYKFGWEPHCFANGTTFDGTSCVFRKCGVDPSSSDSSTDFSPSENGQLGPFLNWTSLAYNAGESRLYGGYHPQSGNLGGLQLGYEVGIRVYNELCKNYIIDCSNGLRFVAATIASRLGSALIFVVALVSCALGLL